MGIEADYILGTIVVGIGATLVMDLWNQFLKRAFSIPSLSYCLLGRWLRHMPGGTLLVSCSRLCSSFLHQATGLRDQRCCLRYSTALPP